MNNISENIFKIVKIIVNSQYNFNYENILIDALDNNYDLVKLLLSIFD